MFKAVSIFVHRFNLLFQFWFINCCIQCAFRLCYCCCPLAVCLDQLRLILSGVHWTLQMSASNLLIPFISVCSSRRSVCLCVCARGRASKRTCLSKTDGDVWLCLCVGNESISFTLVSLPSRGGRVGAASCIGSLFAFSFILFVFSHMLVPFCHYCSLSHLSHILPVTVFASEPSISAHCLHLPVITWLYLL